MKVLLVLVLVNGLVPGLGEIGEAVVHWARTGHVAHTAADRGDLGDQGPEHGCGATLHHCACCASLAVAPAERVAAASPDAPAAQPPGASEAVAIARDPDRPFRPPIS